MEPRAEVNVKVAIKMQMEGMKARGKKEEWGIFTAAC